MKKIIIMMILLITISLFGNESKTNMSGKNLESNDDFLLSHTQSSSLKDFDFRHTNWGMSKKEVEATETLEQYEEDSEDILMRYGHISNLDCMIEYSFTNNLLTSARYLFIEKHDKDNDFLLDYNNIKKQLINKYMEPLEDRESWSNDTYKDDPSQWGFAISLGLYKKHTKWKDHNTDIVLSLTGKPYTIIHQINYSSIKDKHLEDDTEINIGFEDL